MGVDWDELEKEVRALAAARGQNVSGDLEKVFEFLRAAEGPCERKPADFIIMPISLGDGREVAIAPWSGGGARLTIGPVGAGYYDSMWDYETVGAACRALALWSPLKEPEPEGWIRHPPTGRRRPEGDKSREYVHW